MKQLNHYYNIIIVTFCILSGASKPAQRALFIVTLHAFLLVLGGTIAIVTYANQLFLKAAPNLSNELCSVILAVAFFTGSIFSLLVSDLVGRRVRTIITK